jgi:hypothetical protein
MLHAIKEETLLVTQLLEPDIYLFNYTDWDLDTGSGIKDWTIAITGKGNLELTLITTGKGNP